MLINHSIIFAISEAKQKACTGGGDFFGLTPWYHYLPDGKFEGCNIKHFNLLGKNSDVPLVLLAIVDDLLRIAGIVAVAFVIVGAFKYVASQGSPDETAKAQSTIVNALIGLALATISVGIVSFIGSNLGGG